MGPYPALQERLNDDVDIELEVLCRRIRTVDCAAARDLPAQILNFLAQRLAGIDIDIYVEDCVPMVCNASHDLVRAMGTFSPRNADSASVDDARTRLVQALETIADELQACRNRQSRACGVGTGSEFTFAAGGSVKLQKDARGAGR